MGRGPAATPLSVGSGTVGGADRAARARRVGVVVVLVLLLLAALAGARSDTASGTASFRGGAASVALTVVITLGGVAVAVITVAAFYLAATRRRGAPESDSVVRRPWWYSLVVAAAVALLVAVLVLLHHRRKNVTLGAGAAHTAVPARVVHPSSVHFVPADSLTTVAIVVLAVVVLVGAGWWKARRLGTAHRLGDLLRASRSETSAAPSAGLAASIAALRVPRPEEETDPRRAVVACYVSMTRAAADAGAARQPAETPSEFLQRLLSALGASHGAARRLTSLFERARYTTKPVNEGIRADAIAALRAVQGELRRLAAPVPSSSRPGESGAPATVSLGQP